MDRTIAIIVNPFMTPPINSSSWIPEENVTRITPDMVEEYHSRAKVTGPKKLVRAWELAFNPPSVWEYMLEKKMEYHVLVEKYKN